MNTGSIASLLSENPADFESGTGTNYILGTFCTPYSGAEVDVLNIKDILTNYDDPPTSTLSDFVQFSVVGGDTVITIDQDGPAGVYSPVQVITLQGVTGLDAQTMVTDGSLIVS